MTQHEILERTGCLGALDDKVLIRGQLFHNGQTNPPLQGLHVCVKRVGFQEAVFAATTRWRWVFQTQVYSSSFGNDSNLSFGKVKPRVRPLPSPTLHNHHFFWCPLFVSNAPCHFLSCNGKAGGTRLVEHCSFSHKLSMCDWWMSWGIIWVSRTPTFTLMLFGISPNGIDVVGFKIVDVHLLKDWVKVNVEMRAFHLHLLIATGSFSSVSHETHTWIHAGTCCKFPVEIRHPRPQLLLGIHWKVIYICRCMSDLIIVEKPPRVFASSLVRQFEHPKSELMSESFLCMGSALRKKGSS